MLAVVLLLQAPMTPATAASQPVKDVKVIPKKDKGASFYQLLDELLDEAARDIAKLPLDELSPLAIGAVHVSPNLSPELEETLALRLTALLAETEGIKQVHCATCFSVRSRMDGGEWVMTRGIVGREDMQRVATELGVKTFVTLGLEYIDGEDEYLALNLRVLRAKNSTVLYAKRLLSNETEVYLARLGKKRLTPEERRAELDELIEGKPRYGHELMLGYTLVGTTRQSAHTASLGYRIFESFGPKRSLQYGLQLQLFVGEAVGGNVSGVFNYVLRFANVQIPRFRFGIDAGATVVIPSASFGAGVFLEMVTHLGLGLQLAARVTAVNGSVGAGQVTLGGVWAWE